MELVYTQVSKSCDLTIVRVRLPLRVLSPNRRFCVGTVLELAYRTHLKCVAPCGIEGSNPFCTTCGQHDLVGSSPAPSTRSPDGDLFFLIFFAYIISFIYFCININSNSNMETSTILNK